MSCHLFMQPYSSQWSVTDAHCFHLSLRHCGSLLMNSCVTSACSWQDGEVRRTFQRSLQKQGIKFKLGTKARG